MAMIAKVVSEMLMMILAILAAPADSKEFRVDVISPSGRIEMMVVRRTETGFTLLQKSGDTLIECGTIKPVAGKPASYVLHFGEGREQTIDLASDITEFNVDNLRKATTLDLKAKDGVVIRMQRSGSTAYLKAEGDSSIYASH